LPAPLAWPVAPLPQGRPFPRVRRLLRSQPSLPEDQLPVPFCTPKTPRLLLTLHRCRAALTGGAATESLAARWRFRRESCRLFLADLLQRCENGLYRPSVAILPSLPEMLPRPVLLRAHFPSSATSRKDVLRWRSVRVAKQQPIDSVQLRG